MDDTSKYLIHAAITADGVVERSDVVGAIFGQTEGLLGSDLDLRDLQQSSKIGRIDVEIRSEGGRSFGEITIASSLDRVETAILAASLETLTRVGPCRGRIEVTDIQDVREAKRRQVVERAKELLDEAFDEGVLSSDDVLEEVREAVRDQTIEEYEGLPAGPRVADSDAVVVVEGRADVLTLLDHGIKNAVAVEGTDVPAAVADLTRERTVTAFLDGDRGGELILRELAQVGTVDYVAFAPDGRSVEDLDREAAMAALRDKVPYERLPDPDDGDGTLRSAVVGDGGASAVEPSPAVADPDEAVAPDSAPDAVDSSTGSGATPSGESEAEGEMDGPDGADGAEEGAARSADASEVATPSLATHVREVIGADTGRARLLDADLATLAEVDADGAFEAVEESEGAFAVVLDGELSQRVLDVAAQRGVEHVVAASTGEFVKRPVDVRVRTADQIDA